MLLLFVGFNFMLVISDMTDCYLSAFNTVTELRYLSSAFGYILRPATMAIIISIMLRRKKFNFLLWTPIIFVSLIALTTSQTHLMFWFGSKNQYQRGPLGYLSHIVSVLYLIVLIILIARSHRIINSDEIVVIAFIMIICVAATVVESFTSIKFLLPGAMTVSSAMYYIFLHVETYKRDPLTGALNRRSLFTNVQSMSHQKYVIISMDLNGLKDINDINGHQAGDNAIKTFSEICMTTAERKFAVYRTGGDEFIAIGKDVTNEEAEKYIKTLQHKLRQTKYMASFGYAQYTGEGNFNYVCDLADSKMYEDKSRYKHRDSNRKK